MICFQATGNSAGRELKRYLWDFIVNTLSTVLDMLKNIADVFLGWFGTSWNEVWTSIKNFFVGIWDSICSAFQAVADFFPNIWNAISAFFTTIVTAIYTTAVTIFTSVYDFFAGILTSIHDFFATIFNAIWTVISTVCTAIIIRFQASGMQFTALFLRFWKLQIPV